MLLKYWNAGALGYTFYHLALCAFLYWAPVWSIYGIYGIWIKNTANQEVAST